MKIILLDIISEDMSKSVSEEISRNYNIKLNIVKIPSIKNAFNQIRRQYHVERILSELKKTFDEFIAITSDDIYSENLAFTFGNSAGKTAIISLFRLRPEFYKKPSDETLLKNRAVKKALHEVGHVLGLGNCWISGCVMTHVNTVGELDNLSKSLCHRCQAMFGKRR